MYSAKGLASLLAVLLLSLGCMKKPEPDGYRVVGYDAAKNQWTVIRTDTSDGKRVKEKLVLVCDLYKLGDDDLSIDPRACQLEVGDLMVVNVSTSDPQKSLDIFKMSGPSDERLVITEGDGSSRVSQQFVIVKDEILPDKSDR